MSRLYRCWRLFCEMFAIALCVLGGGYAILAVAEDRFARKLKWIRDGELMDLLPVFQMIPGILAGHTAVCLGNRLAGAWGAAIALAGTVLPSVLVFTAVSVFYPRIPVDHPLLAAAFLGLRAAMTGILAVMAVRCWAKAVCSVFFWSVLASALVLLLGFHIAPGWIILGAMIAGVLAAARAGGPPAKAARVFSSFWAIPILFLGYGLIAFGGGYVLVPVYLRDFVGAAAPYLQLSPHEFANVMALTQMTPGPIGVNCATFFGYRMGGIVGAFAATLALVLPGAVILLVVLRSLDRFRSSALVRGIFAGVRPVTLALLIGATLAFAGMSVWHAHGGAFRIDPVGAVLTVLAGLAFGFRRLGAVMTILASAALAVAIGFTRSVL